MTQRAKVPVAEPDARVGFLGSTQWKENTNSYKLSADFTSWSVNPASPKNQTLSSLHACLVRYKRYVLPGDLFGWQSSPPQDSAGV